MLFERCILSQQNRLVSFHLSQGLDTAYLLLYVDDIILTASFTALMQRIISSLHAKFAMTDLGPLNYFLGISATRTTADIFLSQTKYATKILERAHMLNYNPCRTPVDTEKKLGPEGSPVTDPTLYRSLAGALQYLTFTRPDLSYAVQQLCLYRHDPREPHLNAMKRVLRYLQRTTDLGINGLLGPSKSYALEMNKKALVEDRISTYHERLSWYWRRNPRGRKRVYANKVIGLPSHSLKKKLAQGDISSWGNNHLVMR
ncbi:ribonuclease H-like domain-containing protein [Tanacetum coccineum]